MISTAELYRILVSGNHSLALDNDTGVHTYGGRGVSDLYTLLSESPQLLRGANVADKVVGKGAATLMVLGGVKALHAGVISSPALQLLRENSVAVTFDTEVPNIINRRGDGICPIETLCLPYSQPEECLTQIKNFTCNQPSNSKH